jgi:VWFA-related protein
MRRIAHVLSLALALLFAAFAAPGDDDVVFRSDVSLVRVDAQVVDSSNRAITHLNVEDFVLREDGKVVPIRNFASENMPVDVLFLLDVSGSMRPHVQRIADASGQALTVLGKDDRMGIMVFDRYTRVRLALNSSRQEVRRGFDKLLSEERFNGGTDITRAMLDAADYIRREGRRDARRAIVILTDDETELNRDDQAVGRALARADAVMCALIAPDAGQYRGYPGGGGGGQRRGTWGSGGGGIGGGIPGVIFGPRGGGGGGPYGGRRGGGGMGGNTQSAGTSEIARDSGGDSMSVNDASALEETLSRLRQRYTLYFNLPDGVKPGEERGIEVALTASAQRRHGDAEVRYRRVFMGSGSGNDAAPVRVTRAPVDTGYSTAPASSSDSSASTTRRRRVAVNQDGTPISGPTTDDGSTSPGPLKPSPDGQTPSTAPNSPGWRKVDPTKQQ